MAFVLASTQANAFDGIGSDHLRLKKTVIADIGEAQKVPPPENAKWSNQVYSLNSRCFTILGYFGFWGFGSKSAMIVVDENKAIQLAVFEISIGDIGVTLHPIQMVQCPSHAYVPPSCDGKSYKECSKLLDEYQKELQREIDRLTK